MPLTGVGRDARPRGVLVTGAAGFIGSRIVRRLLTDGFAVLAVVHSADPGRLSRLRTVLGRRDGAPLHVIPCDLLDRCAVDRLASDHRVAACVHAAWGLPPQNYRDDAANQLWVKASLHMFNALRQAGCRWLGCLGTCIEPGPNERPSCRYAAAKATLRHRLFDACRSPSKKDGTQVCWWQIFQPYGPGEPVARFIPSLINALLSGQPFHLNTPSESRDFIHVDDIASAISASIIHRLQGVYELGAGHGYFVREIAEVAAGMLNARQLISATPNAAEPRDAARIANPQPLMSAANWRPEISLQAGLAAFIDESRHRLRASA